jgi:hypothetical protein
MPEETPGLLLLMKKKKSMKGSPQDEPDMPDMDEGDEPHSEDETKLAIADALIKAVKLGDAHGVVQSFKDLSDLCSGSDGSEKDGEY